MFIDCRSTTPSWLHATAMAPRKVPAKQRKNTAGETGIGTRMTRSATSAAQNGSRFKIADTMMGWALLKPKL